MNLFDDIDRTYLGYASDNEDTYTFLNRSAKEEFSEVRDTLNDWFNNYPEEEKNEFKMSFQKQFKDRFFELFLFQLFSKLGFSLDIHPNLPNTSNKPDFCITKGDNKIIVEAKIVKGISNSEERILRKTNQFYESLSKIKLKGFGLTIKNLKIRTEKQPSVENIKKRIVDVISALDQQEMRFMLENEKFHNIPVIKFDTEEIFLEVKPFPLPIEKKEVILEGILFKHHGVGARES